MSTVVLSPRCRRVQPILFATLALFSFLGFVGCDGWPQAPNQQGTGYEGLYDASEKTMEFRLADPNGGASSLLLVASGIDLDEETQEVRAWVALRNTGDVATSGPEQIVVDRFSPRDVEPLNALCDPFPCDDGAGCARVCTFDHSGTYGDDGLLEPGETSEARQWIFRNPSRGSFAFHARMGRMSGPAEGLIAGVVFRDANGNGARDAGEPGIPAVPVQLRFEDGSVRAMTNDRGAYDFRVESPGLYELVWDSASSCEPTTPTTLQVVILRRPDGSLSNFTQGHFGCRGLPQQGVPVAGIVFHDANENGVFDRGEVGVPGVEVTAAALQCPTFAPITVRTGRDGRYRLLLPECEPPYDVFVSPIPGWSGTTPASLRFDSPPAPGSVLRADFGVVPDGTLPELFVEGTVFLDRNRNGQREADEPGVADVELSASGLVCLTPIAAVARTDAQGRYRMRGADVHCPLPWIVKRYGHWEDTTANPIFLNEPPPNGNDTFRVDFGVAPPDTVPPPDGFAIVGFVFHDRDGDGVFDFGEPGIANAEVQLQSPCEVLRLARTDSRGRYQFAPDVVGACSVTAVWQSAPEFADRTTPNPFPLDGTTPPGAVRMVNFGVRLDNVP